MTSDGPTTVLLVDDHPLVRQGLQAVLSTVDDITVVGEASDGRAAVELAAELEPKVIIMDLQLRWSRYATDWHECPGLPLVRSSEVRHASCRCLAWLTFLAHSSSALRDDVQPLGSPHWLTVDEFKIEIYQ